MNMTGQLEYMPYDDGTAMIVGYHGDAAELDIPAQIDGHTVTAIAEEAFRDCMTLERISIPDSVMDVGDLAFCGCSALRSIVLPGSVKFIGEEVFGGCTSLQNAVIKEGVECIRYAMFCGCRNLSSVTIPESVFMLQAYAFSGCSSLKRIAIPDGLTQIKGNPFVSCGVETFDISPEHPTLEVIDGALFERKKKCLICYPAAFSAERYTIPQGTRSLADAAFRGCRSLRCLSIPESVTSIGNWAFGECDHLTCVIVRDSPAERGCQQERMRYVYAEAALEPVSDPQ